jgi:hypothetical protein
MTSSVTIGANVLINFYSVVMLLYNLFLLVSNISIGGKTVYEQQG